LSSRTHLLSLVYGVHYSFFSRGAHRLILCQFIQGLVDIMSVLGGSRQRRMGYENLIRSWDEGSGRYAG
jgi:hypothetical protein